MEIQLKFGCDTNMSSSPVPLLCDTEKCISIKHYDGLISELKCPGCAEPMESPIKLCATGHSICGNCTNKLHRCPLCKAGLTDMRSYTLEAIIAKANFRCPNWTKGCSVWLPLKLMMWHKEKCMFKPVDCTMGKVWNNCNWHGFKTDWLSHCREMHSEHIFHSPTVDMSWNFKEDVNRHYKSISGFYMISVFNETFHFYHIYNQKEAAVVWTVMCATNDPKISQNFAFEVELYSPTDESRLFIQRFGCQSEQESNIPDDAHSCQIKIADASRFMTMEMELHYRVRIIKVAPPRCFNLMAIPSPTLPLDYEMKQIENCNLKGIPDENIIVRKIEREESVEELIEPDEPVIALKKAHSSGNIIDKISLKAKFFKTPFV